MSTAEDRRVQRRSLQTRAALLDAAIASFTTRGFDGSSVRQLEEVGGVKRGLVAYHFGDKDGLWRAAVDRLFAELEERFGARLVAFADLPPPDAARAVVRAFVRFSAAHPELHRLMMQECTEASWRVEHIVRKHVRPVLDRFRAILPDAFELLLGAEPGEAAAHRYYLFIGAAAFVFSAEQECLALFGTTPRSEEFVDRHADAVADLLISAAGGNEGGKA